MTRDRLRPAALARQVLLPPVVGGVGVACLFVVLTAAGGQRPKATNPLVGGSGSEELTRHVSTDVEGTPTSADVRRARRP
ncbi:MAG: hypothetical protein QOF69_2524 [Solirubrobacteraceae bacterium]|nr:hypothetical protein [Solirubrobacteraceae bacterium]